MAKRYTDEQRWLIEVKLVLDIIKFVGLFHRKPTKQEVVDWAQDQYSYKVNGMHNGWATGLIKRATKGLNVHKRVRKSGFELYGGIETKCPALCRGDFKPSEMVGIDD